MSQEAEVDMKEVELNELEPEKQPMNVATSSASGGEKNGVVKVKVEDGDSDGAAAKFTGLSKEELLKVAGTPAWVRTRWALLLLFWLGWLGMLAGAVVIIVQAPRCRELPVQRWWHQGALYRIGNLKAFEGHVGNGSLAGVKTHLDYLNSLKVKAIILGPIHKNIEDDLAKTNLLQIDPTFGSQEDFMDFLETAKKKSIKVVLDLTPNYRSQSPWFMPNQSEVVNEKMKEALNFWLSSVNGIQVRDVNNLTDASSYLSLWSNLTHSISDDKVLIAGTRTSDLSDILSLLNDTDLLSSSYLEDFARRSSSGKELKELVSNYLTGAGNNWCTWTYSQVGHLASYVPAQLLRLYHILLFTLPGTPIFNYGDEIGLKEATLPRQPAEAPFMPWDEKTLEHSESVNLNMTVQGQKAQSGSLLSLFSKLSELRGKDQSLLHGDFLILPTHEDLFAYVRHWDQSERFLVVLNLSPSGHNVDLKVPPGSTDQNLELPEEATLVFSTEARHETTDMVPLLNLPVAPGEGLLFKFPYVA